MNQTSTQATPTDDWYSEHFDHLAPEVTENLFATLSHMRSRCPVVHSDQHGGFWVVTRYEDVFTVAEDWETFSSAHGLTVPVAPVAVRNLPTESDPPLHRFYKRLINPYFSPSAVWRWEPETRRLVTRLIDRFAGEGRCEFMEAFARPYPALSFFDYFLNAPAEEIDHVAHLASKTSIPSDPEAAECWAGLSEWIRHFVEDRRAGPRKDDVVDAVLGADVDGRPITDEEVIGLLQLLVLGGLETTAGALGLAVIRLAREPRLFAELRTHPELIPPAVEEFLRLDPPFILEARTATRETEFGGHQVKKGEKVLIYWISAGRDESEFPDADVFHLDRPRNRHLTFGVGIHRCAGSNLARMNMRVALEEIVRRLAALRLETEEIVYHTTFTRSPLAVPIIFEAA